MHYLLEQAKQFLVEGRLDDALKKVETLISQSSLEVGYHLSCAFEIKGQICEQKQDVPSAISCYEKALELDSTNSSPQHNLGILYTAIASGMVSSAPVQSQAYFERARQYLLCALEIAPNHPNYLHSLAGLYEQQVALQETLNEAPDNISKTYEQAIGYYQSAAFGTNDEVFKNIVLQNLAECVAQAGHHEYHQEKYNEAALLYTKVLIDSPRHIAAHTQLGWCALKQDKLSLALQNFKALLDVSETDEDKADAWLNLAATYRLQRDYQAAKNSIDKAKTYNSTDEYIQREAALLQEINTHRLKLISAVQGYFAQTGKQQTDTEIKAEHYAAFNV